jgi:hypothetical protein
MASAEAGSAAFLSTVNCYATLVKSPATAALTDFTVHQQVIEDVLDAVRRSPRRRRSTPRAFSSLTKSRITSPRT